MQSRNPLHSGKKHLWRCGSTISLADRTEGIAPAITETGYSPIRIDFQEHSESVIDRIIRRDQGSTIPLLPISRAIEEAFTLKPVLLVDLG